MRIAVVLLCGALSTFAQKPQLDFLNHDRPVLDAHNCYPYEGRYADRIERALGTGFPVAVEQDIAWAVDPVTHQGRPVVSHTAKTTGAEPTLRDHFFERVRPIVEKALAQGDRASWPLIVLHFDFKSLEPKPVLVLTEDADEQEGVFFRRLPAAARLRVFGSAHTTPIAGSRRRQVHLAATLPPDLLLREQPTNYRRWWNCSWYEVEEGGQPHAGGWTSADAERLQTLVDYAHQLGFWIRFYTLDGFSASENRGWDSGYNFGSHPAVAARWKAAVESGVNLIATDQYEELAAFLQSGEASRGQK